MKRDTKSKIRKETCLIIRRGSDYLVGRIIGSMDLRWSDSPWCAWRTRDREAAEMIARMTGGDIWLFNPIVGQARAARWTKEAEG